MSFGEKMFSERLQVPTAVLLQIQVFWDVMLCHWISITVLMVVLPCILISTKLFYQQIHLLLKHKMLQFIFKISFLLWLLQSGRSIAIRHKEHVPYIRTNNPASAYALHILNNRH